jgi:hypothetical protein
MFSFPPSPLRPGLIIAMAWGAALLLSGCVSSGYRAAKKETPPAQLLNIPLSASPLETTVNAVITYNGPGSWKRNAFWDEYVVTLRNPGNQPLTLTTTELVDSAGINRPAGSDPWALQKESKTLEQQYKDTGVAFVRYTAPAALIVGGGSLAIASAGAMTAAGGVAIGATIIALPVFYLVVLTVNHSNKVAMEAEFTKRRLVLPLTLAPGEKHTSSLFFPMVVNPRSLRLAWVTGAGGGGVDLGLEFLHGLHVEAPAPSAAGN